MVLSILRILDVFSVVLMKNAFWVHFKKTFSSIQVAFSDENTFLNTNRFFKRKGMFFEKHASSIQIEFSDGKGRFFPQEYEKHFFFVQIQVDLSSGKPSQAKETYTSGAGAGPHVGGGGSAPSRSRRSGPMSGAPPGQAVRRRTGGGLQSLSACHVDSHVSLGVCVCCGVLVWFCLSCVSSTYFPSFS